MEQPPNRSAYVFSSMPPEGRAYGSFFDLLNWMYISFFVGVICIIVKAILYHMSFLLAIQRN
jgi:hypothetical protein